MLRQVIVYSRFPYLPTAIAITPPIQPTRDCQDIFGGGSFIGPTVQWSADEASSGLLSWQEPCDVMAEGDGSVAGSVKERNQDGPD